MWPACIRGWYISGLFSILIDINNNNNNTEKNISKHIQILNCFKSSITNK